MKFISYEESIIALDALEITPKPKEMLFLMHARGRVLAEDIVAFENSPAYPTAAMDGYAIKAVDQAKGTLSIAIDDNPAGSAYQGVVVHGAAIKTFTGSLMPQGADTLIPIECVEVLHDTIIIKEPVSLGYAVRPVGESYRKGEVLLTKGTTIEFAQIGVLAGLGVVMVPVVSLPKVAILATGSEIIDLGVCASLPAQIRSSNNYTLAALVEQHGGQAIQMGVVGDHYAQIKQRIREALELSDIVVTTGGVSVGDYDFVKDIIPSLGAQVVYKGVAIKPGQHVMVAKQGSKFIVGLPGFAYSSTVTFILYVVPLLAFLKGQAYAPNIVQATLRSNFTKRTNKTEFIACNVRLVNGLYEIDFEGKKSGSSAILTNMLGSTGLFISGHDAQSLSQGACVDVMLLG